MSSLVEIPGGCDSLKYLLYPFHISYPLKFWSKYRWWRNGNLKRVIHSLNKAKAWLTVIDRLGAPGDALITANVIRCIKKKYSSLKINCITPHPELVRLDPNIDSINQNETFYSFDSTYWELIVSKEKRHNIIKHNLQRLGIAKYEYKANYYLSQEEKDWVKQEITQFKKPILAICTKSKETVKNWSERNWLELIQKLKTKFSIIHLGDDKEPTFKDNHRYAGKLSMRKSAAILSHASYFIGPDSLLMHVANGLNIPSVIIFGGSRPAKCFGYDDNINLISAPECSPCWIHDGYDACNYSLKCLNQISVTTVLQSVDSLLKNNSK